MGLSEEEIVEINKQAEADVDAQIAAEAAATWRALENAPPEVVAEIKKLVG
jgi:hypothetical protein